MTDSLEHVSRIPPLPARDPDAHKGNFGRVLVVGGCVGMAGAPALAGMSALRSGAGLATVAVPAPIQPTVAAICPCATTIGLPATPSGQIDPAGARRTFEDAGLLGEPGQAAPPDVLVVGPGVGPGDARYGRQLWELIDAFRITASVATIVDADALNLAHRTGPDNPGGWDQRPHPNTAITPHPGELARMVGTSAGEIQADREGHAVRTARTMAEFSGDAAGPVVVLKGANTIVTDGTRVYTNDTGNPGMATGGSGDVLAGVLAGLIGQGLSLFDASVAAVCVHGLAGDVAARDVGPVSLIATDIIDALPEAFIRQWPDQHLRRES